MTTSAPAGRRLDLLLRVSRRLESDPSLIGHAPHIMAVATHTPAAVRDDESNNEAVERRSA